MANLTTIFTGTYKIISPLHQYNSSLLTEDVVIIATRPYDSLYYIAVNKITEKIICRKKIICKNIIKKELENIDSNINFSYLTINSISGIYANVNDTNIATLFIIFEHKNKKTNYVCQLDILNHNVANVRIKVINELYDKRHIYFDTVVTSNTVINDYKSTVNTDAYLTYINMDNKIDLSASNVEGILLLITDEEKNAYKEQYNATLPDEIYPYLDSNFRIPRIFFKLTEDTTKIKFNFSTGLGFIKFKD